MSPLTLRFPDLASTHLNLFGIVPDQLQSLTLQDISQLTIEANGRTATLGEYCEVTDGDRHELCFEGDLSHCDYVGGGMARGRLSVRGNTGDFLADEMSGGRIDIGGSAGRFACSSMKGGVVEVAGDCGEYAASAARGAKRGMNGGVLVIRGNCDQWLATRMRRGTVIVHGRTAAACASRMIAGTLVLCGPVDFPLAADMARGTILLLGPSKAITAPSGFTDPEHTELSFLQILMNDVSHYLPLALRDTPLPPVVFRSLGDRVNRGLGEVIWLGLRPVSEPSAIAHA